MKIGFYSESLADQAALAVFAEGILGAPPEPINMALAGHGVTSVFSALDGLFRGVYYNSDAEGLVVAVDCNASELHDPAHDDPGPASDDCRLCRARKIIGKARRQLKSRPDRPHLKVAVGLAVPAIEAWYFVGTRHEVGEQTWRTRLEEKRDPSTRKKLKELMYGTTRPSLELETELAVREARRIIQNIEIIEKAFPVGFGSMAAEIRSWKTQ
jgi:hypothetical protein